MSKVKHIDGQELVDILNGNKSDYQFIDVRTPMEYESGHLEVFKNIPLQSLEQETSELNKERAIIIICASGSRSLSAARYLSKFDFKEIINVRGGLSVFR